MTDVDTQATQSFVQDLGVGVQEPSQAVSAVTEAQGDIRDFLTLEDVAPEQDDEEEIKSTAGFSVAFIKTDSTKKLKGSKAACEVLYAVEFVYQPAAAVEEEPKKKRGPKPKAQQQEQAKAPTALAIKFYDDVENRAVDFVESLAEREDFVVVVSSLNDKGQAVENFTFEGCTLTPTVQHMRFSRNVHDEPRFLEAIIKFTSVTRESVSAADSDE